MELITLTTKTRGRGSREVQYQGVGRIERTGEGDKVEENVVTEGVLSSLEDALALPGIQGQLQRLLDFAVIGYNKFQRDAALDVDEFAGFIDAAWDEKKVDAFKRAVRALAKAADLEVSDAAEIVKAKMAKADTVAA